MERTAIEAITANLEELELALRRAKASHLAAIGTNSDAAKKAAVFTHVITSGVLKGLTLRLTVGGYKDADSICKPDCGVSSLIYRFTLLTTDTSKPYEGTSVNNVLAHLDGVTWTQKPVQDSVNLIQEPTGCFSMRPYVYTPILSRFNASGDRLTPAAVDKITKEVQRIGSELTKSVTTELITDLLTNSIAEWAVNRPYHNGEAPTLPDSLYIPVDPHIPADILFRTWEKKELVRISF